MVRKTWVRAFAALAVLTMSAAACSSDNNSSSGSTAASTAATTAASTAASTAGTTAATTGATTGSTTGSTQGTTTTSGGGQDLAAIGLWDNGPCDESLPPYPIATQSVGESAVLNLEDDVTALKASVKAFNDRGGIKRHCMKLTVCESAGDPNKEVDCARQITASDAVATLSDTSPFNTAATSAVYEQAQLPRWVISPGTEELGTSMSFPLDAGGTGTTFVMLPGCTHNGHTKIAVIHVDTPTIGALFDAMGPMLKAYNAEIVTKIPVPAGTTDYQQFILSAQAAGADCIMLPLGENESKQVLAAAQQLGTKLEVSMSGGTLGSADVKQLGDFGKQIIFNAGYPPISAAEAITPVAKVALDDLKASGDPGFTEDQLKTSPFRSWLAVYTFVYMLEHFGTPDTISKEAVLAAAKAAKSIPMYGLTPDWTPTQYALAGTPFGAVSQPWYWLWKYDTASGQWTMQDKKVNVVNEIIGKTDYPQPS